MIHKVYSPRNTLLLYQRRILITRLLSLAAGFSHHGTMRLIEQEQLSPTAIDTEEGVIRGVRILGPSSKNGRRYSPQAIKSAAGMYEGVAVNVDHSRDATDRPVADAFGWLRGVAVRENAVYGDLHYLKSHPSAPLLVEVAQRNPNRLGLSHHAEGTVRMDGGTTIVETVERVHSVDLVQTPATNAGLFESEGGYMQVEGDKKPVTEADEFKAKVMEAMDMDGDMGEMVAKLKALLAAMETPEEPSLEIEMGEADKMGEKPMAESFVKIMSKLDVLVEGFAVLKADHDARALLESAGREVTRERLEALKAMPGDKRATLVESWPAAQRAARPAASPPAAAVAAYPTNTSGFLAAIRN